MRLPWRKHASDSRLKTSGETVFAGLGLQQLGMPKLRADTWREVGPDEVRIVLACVDELADAELDAAALVRHVERLIRARDAVARRFGRPAICAGGGTT